MQETIDKQKAEIERLTEENEAYKEVKHIDIINELSKENAELQKKVDELTAKYRNLEINYNAVWEDFRKYEVENEELQKQVDELKAENTELYKEHTTLIAGSILQKQVEKLTAFKNEAISTSLYGKGGKDGAEVAVKDTAKEILIPLVETEKQIDPLKTGIRWSVLKGFCKRYGVEVE